MPVDGPSQLTISPESTDTKSSSGIAAVSGVPADWGTAKLKRVTNLNMGSSPPSERYNQDGEGVPFLQGNAEFGRVNPAPETYCVEPTKRARDQDLLLSVRAPVGAVNIADQEYGIGRGLCAISPRQDLVQARFVYYVLLSVAQPQLEESSTGSTYEAVSADDVGRVVVPLPDQPTQAAISQFLQDQTSKIDRLIDKKERLIELLEERRTALITKAMTKGLDPDVPMKDSGVEWLGEIPEHWETTRIGYHVDVVNGFPFSSERFSNTQGIPLIRIRDLGNENTEAYYKGVPETDFRVQSGDIVIGMDGDFEVDRWSGEPALLNQRLCCLKTHDSLNERFLYYSLPAPLDVINDLTHSTTVKHLSSKQVRRIKICYPSLDEQRKIGEKLDMAMNRLDKLAQRIRQAIDQLEEYRSALITAAVTGTIDVRDQAA